MKQVEFHYNVADKLAYSCRLLRKIVARDLRVVVIGDGATLQALDQALWLPPTEFMAHCRAGAPQATLAASPIWLVESWAGGHTHAVMLNLGAGVPEHFDQVERYLEVVSTHPDDVAAARQRWRHYQGLGMAIERFDRQGKP
jgi:DNA polymerase-3 subunit chi